MFCTKTVGEVYNCRKKFVENKSTIYLEKNVDNIVDNVDNYCPKRVSPTFTMSPAPIVINKSPFIQFSNKKFSI